MNRSMQVQLYLANCRDIIFVDNGMFHKSVTQAVLYCENRVFRWTFNIFPPINVISYTLVLSGAAHHKRSAGAGAIQLGGIADLQPERLPIPESERESHPRRSSRTVSILLGECSSDAADKFVRPAPRQPDIWTRMILGSVFNERVCLTKNIKESNIDIYYAGTRGGYFYGLVSWNGNPAAPTRILRSESVILKRSAYGLA